jgi:hypothetical protein
MLCQNPTCRKPIDDDATFCVHCGASQNDEQPTVIKPFGSTAAPTEVLRNFKAIKICPTCKKQFADEYAFCLDDGTTLETFAPVAVAPTQRFEFCGGCGAPMSNEYAFCKNCGAPRERSAEPNFVPFAPVPAPEIRRSWFDENKTLVAVMACAAIFLLLGGGLFFALTRDDGKIAAVNNSNVNANRAANNSSRTPTPANTVANITPLPPANVQAGQTGRLLTDLNIRDEPNKYAASKGIHFRGAKVRILDSTTYETPEGETSTWYRVKVFEYGCSADTNLGCGKNSPGDSDEGWMNGRYISVD